MNNVLPPDGIVKGRIDSRKGTQANLWLNLSFYKSAPTGAFYSIIKTRDKKHQVKYSISSNCPVDIKTRRIYGADIIKATFINTTAYNSGTDEAKYTCRAVFSATQTKPGIWTGGLKVVYPDGRELIVYGAFQGSVTVNRQVTGKRDIFCVTGGT